MMLEEFAESLSLVIYASPGVQKQDRRLVSFIFILPCSLARVHCSRGAPMPSRGGLKRFESAK
jgi:hypothetical protein